MKKKQKLLGVICLVSFVALIATSIIVADPVTDEPIGGFCPGGAGPVTDEPIGDFHFNAGGAGPVTDEPIGEIHGFAVG